MENKYKVKCVKCKKEYESDEPDDYYCEVCNKARLELAKEIDARIASRPRKNVISELQVFDALADNRGFVKMKDLGITL